MLKLTSYFLLIISTLLCFSCRKEFSLEVEPVIVQTAVYSFSGTPGSCTNPAYAGNYQKGKVLTVDNKISISVDVKTIGTYIIATAAVNGITFKGTGTFTVTGPQVIWLTGLGIPIAEGTFNYLPATGSCSFSIVVLSNNAPTAIFTYAGSPGTCIPAIPSGVYTSGAALTAANTVVIGVNVSAVGIYTIATPVVNGFSFVGSGNFTTTGNQSVTLTATGTPGNAGISTFKPPNNGCSFSVTVLPNIVIPITGSFHVKINDTLTTFNIIASTFIRSTATNEKRFDLTGTSTNGYYRLTITIGAPTAIGNNVGLGPQPVRLFLEDDPATPDLDESQDSYAFYTLSTSLGNGGWLTDVYRIKGVINIAANTSNTTTGNITATFSGTLNDIDDPTLNRYTFTEGGFTSISYMILN